MQLTESIQPFFRPNPNANENRFQHSTKRAIIYVLGKSTRTHESSQRPLEVGLNPLFFRKRVHKSLCIRGGFFWGQTQCGSRVLCFSRVRLENKNAKKTCIQSFQLVLEVSRDAERSFSVVKVEINTSLLNVSIMVDLYGE